tara:strand:- start:883 stop:1047 length:165 start_codon:yes stop_codon:yes gene_type:complete
VLQKHVFEIFKEFQVLNGGTDIQKGHLQGFHIDQFVWVFIGNKSFVVFLFQFGM